MSIYGVMNIRYHIFRIYTISHVLVISHILTEFWYSNLLIFQSSNLPIFRSSDLLIFCVMWPHTDPMPYIFPYTAFMAYILLVFHRGGYTYQITIFAGSHAILSEIIIPIIWCNIMLINTTMNIFESPFEKKWYLKVNTLDWTTGRMLVAKYLKF